MNNIDYKLTSNDNKIVDLEIKEYISNLFDMAEPKYKEFAEKLAKSPYELLGVRIPTIRNLAKKCIRKHNTVDELVELFSGFEKSIINDSINTHFEVIMLYGIILGTSCVDDEIKLSYLNNYIDFIADWSVCDSVSTSIKVNSKRRLLDFLIGISKNKREFTLRFVVVMCLNHFMLDEYIDEVERVITGIDVEYYYTNMAIAWWLSELYMFNKERYFKILYNNGFNRFVLKTSIQKIIDSNRVSQDEKNNFIKIKSGLALNKIM